ncbi:Sterol O-acyltransferase 2 (Sterol-ester synthase 2) [Elasticomyces elasticus]|nr:Sterol O-acyltransferase 2 (Sterol-ester synthase 2) [Elasticomyces elasticus]
MNPQVLRAASEVQSLEVPPPAQLPSSSMSSSPPTPVPQDAPPSQQATSAARRQLRAQQKHRLFPHIEYTSRVSHFDPRSEYRDFRGFFVLFWIGLAIMVITAMLRNLKETGYPLSIRQWGLFTENIWELAVSDGAMVASTAISLPLHRLYMYSRGWLRWNKGGMAVQSIFQALWLAYWVSWPFMRDWTWTAQVFFTLHLLAIFMKMHSYAFYNGHLSNTLERLSSLDSPSKARMASTAAAVRYPSSRTRLQEIRQDDEEEEEEEEISEAENEKKEVLNQLREDLAMELTGPMGRVTYPKNLTVANYVDYLLCPTLCYELEYPRTPQRSYLELFYKTLAVFGCIFLMTVTSEAFIIPVLDDSAWRLQSAQGWQEGGLIFAETVSTLLFPFMVIFLLVFLVIFEYVLGAFAEITCFADRHFYADWWNSHDWLEFSREWNIPVHHFFRRHVYSASRPTFSRPVATLITFLLSALAHELVMGCITRKFRGYGFVAMMLQMPIVLVQRSRLMRGRGLLGNVLFWCSMILGLSTMCALYVLV